MAPLKEVRPSLGVCQKMTMMVMKHSRSCLRLVGGCQRLLAQLKAQRGL